MWIAESGGLPTGRLVGLGFDVAAAVFGSMNGAQAVFRRKYPQATYVHCSAHVLNLVFVKASEREAIKARFGTISEAAMFFRCSAHRSTALKVTMEGCASDVRKTVEKFV